MPKKTLKNAQGDTWTISLDEGESVGSTQRGRAGKYSGGTFSAKTPTAALKLYEQMIQDEMEYGFFDPKAKASAGKRAKTAAAAKKPRISDAEWRKWWRKLPEEWQAALNAEADVNAPDDGFEAIAALTEFTAQEAGLDDVSPLARLTQLESVSLYGNAFSDLKPLTALKNLKVLEIDNCTEVDDIKPLAKLTKLEELNLGYTSVSDLTPVYKLKSLKTINLAGLENQFDDWKAELAKLKKALPKCRLITAD